jgi:protein-L-isoaspartate(D-aspartate) O-methyltransferase
MDNYMDDAKKNFISNVKKEINNKYIISAFEKFDQKYFFDTIFSKNFYSDTPIPIGCGQKSDSLNVLAIMINYLSPDGNSRILEVGTGSGYSTAILSSLVKEVVTIEYHEELALSAKDRIINLGIKNVKFLTGNAFEYEAAVPFNGAIIFAAYHERPLYMFQFLKKDGTIVFPMGPPHQQQIAVLKAKKDKSREREYAVTFHEFCQFSPLIDIFE